MSESTCAAAPIDIGSGGGIDGLIAARSAAQSSSVPKVGTQAIDSCAPKAAQAPVTG